MTRSTREATIRKNNPRPISWTPEPPKIEKWRVVHLEQKLAEGVPERAAFAMYLGPFTPLDFYAARLKRTNGTQVRLREET